MKQKVILVCGGAATGKTCSIRHLLGYMLREGLSASLCKIDCLHTADGEVFKRFGLPYITALSGDICPDHFLVSNLEELIDWSSKNNTPYLVIETAGLCNRCCPTTQNVISVCTVDCTASLRSPEKIGPMLTTCDIVLLTKADQVPQAEREIVRFHVQKLNPNAAIIYMDGLSGYGADLLWRCLQSLPFQDSLQGDLLRYTMPTGVCSYCVGERRIGSAFQQGMVEKINFEEALARA